MKERILYPKVAPATSRDLSASTDLCLWDSHDSSSADTLLESSFPEHINGRRQHVMQRAPHSKSRTGCLNCKRRRIKCEENRPSCTQCTKRRIQCEWPEIQIRDGRSGVHIGLSRPSVRAPPQSAEAKFTMQDFRLFHHFIQKAYPHHPIGNDSVWTHEIPSISHNYDYLLHAMLGLSASDITTSQTPAPELTCSAMSHRVVAIKALNQALSRGLQTFEESNAMLATCYVLLFQSVLLEDGLAEFMSFLRGCVLIAQNMGCRNMKFLFHSFFGMDGLKMMEPHLKDEPEVNPGPVDSACKSLEAFAPLCQKEYEKSFHDCLMKTVKSLYTSSRNAYISLTEMYGMFAWRMSHEEFQDFINPSNEVGQLLQSHFVAVQLLLHPITVHELGDRKPEKPSNESRRWLGAIHDRVSPLMREFFEWPISVAAGVETGSFYEELEGSSPETLQCDESMSEEMQDEV